jgi:hypothetical protein
MNIPAEILQIKLGIQRIEASVKSIPELADLLAEQTLVIDRSLGAIEKLAESTSIQIGRIGEQVDAQGLQITQLVQLLTPKPAVSAVGTVIARNPQTFGSAEDGEFDMALKFKGRKFSGKPASRKAGADVEIQDDGTALYTATALDSDGNPTAWPTGATLTNPVVSDPSTVAGGPYWAVTPNTADPTGASLIGTPQNVSPAPAGALPDVGVGLSATVTFPNVAPFQITFPLIDVIMGPASTAVGTVASNNPTT